MFVFAILVHALNSISKNAYKNCVQQPQCLPSVIQNINKEDVPSSDAKFKNFSETNSCFFVSRSVVQNEPSLDSVRKVKIQLNRLVQYSYWAKELKIVPFNQIPRHA